MINRLVPYKSQHDADAKKSHNDCGPASIAMILNYYEKKDAYTTDVIFEKTGAGQGLVSIPQMEKAISACGYQSQYITNVTPEKLKEYLDADIIPIVLVHYGALISTQDKNFKGGHFFPVVGYRDDGYFVNDPNFFGGYRTDGDHHFYTKNEFEKAWSSCNVDGNQNNTLLVIFPKNEQLPVTEINTNITVVSQQGVNIRTEPTTKNTNIVQAVKKDTVLMADGFLLGEELKGNPYWYRMKNALVYVWAGATSIPNPTSLLPTFSENNKPDSNKEANTPLSMDELEIKYKIVNKDYEELLSKYTYSQEVIKKLQDTLQKTNEEMLANEEIVKEIQTYKHTNQALSEQIKLDDDTYKNKIKELKNEIMQRDAETAHIFDKWELFEIKAGVKGLLSLPIIITRLVLLFRNIAQHNYVVGWKKDGELVKV